MNFLLLLYKLGMHATIYREGISEVYLKFINFMMIWIKRNIGALKSVDF